MSMTKKIFQQKIKGEYDIVKLQGWLQALPNNLVSNTEKMSFVKKMKVKLDKVEVESWVNALQDKPLTAVAPGAQPVVQPIEEILTTGPKKKKVPSKFKKGDTLMHPIFRHPYVLLEKKGNSWICGLLTSEPNCPEILEKTDSRFFSDEYFTKVMFTTKDPIGTFMYPFENTKQLKSVLIQLKQIFL
jgi:hypothetical protein